MAKIPDDRLDRLAALYNPRKLVHTSLEYVDVAAIGQEALKESEEQLRGLSVALLTAQESERRRISTELHDQLGHSLVLLKLRLGHLARELPDVAGAIDQDAARAVTMRDRPVDAMRQPDAAQEADEHHRIDRDHGPRVAREQGRPHEEGAQGDRAQLDGPDHVPAVHLQQVLLDPLRELRRQVDVELRERGQHPKESDPQRRPPERAVQPQQPQRRDILALLREKTRGNLTPTEQQVLDQLLQELRLRYVELSAGGGGRSEQ